MATSPYHCTSVRGKSRRTSFQAEAWNFREDSSTSAWYLHFWLSPLITIVSGGTRSARVLTSPAKKVRQTVSRAWSSSVWSWETACPAAGSSRVGTMINSAMVLSMRGISSSSGTSRITKRCCASLRSAGFRRLVHGEQKRRRRSRKHRVIQWRLDTEGDRHGTAEDREQYTGAESDPARPDAGQQGQREEDLCGGSDPGDGWNRPGWHERVHLGGILGEVREVAPAHILAIHAEAGADGGKKRGGQGYAHIKPSQPRPIHGRESLSDSISCCCLGHICNSGHDYFPFAGGTSTLSWVSWSQTKYATSLAGLVPLALAETA